MVHRGKDIANGNINPQFPLVMRALCINAPMLLLFLQETAYQQPTRFCACIPLMKM